MTLVERLREAAIYGPIPCPICYEAADRIEALEAEVAALRRVHDAEKVRDDMQPDELVALKDEDVRKIGGEAFGIDIAFDGHLMRFARAIERAHGIDAAIDAAIQQHASGRGDGG